jgi:hypothetical protein
VLPPHKSSPPPPPRSSGNKRGLRLGVPVARSLGVSKSQICGEAEAQLQPWSPHETEVNEEIAARPAYYSPDRRTESPCREANLDCPQPRPSDVSEGVAGVGCPFRHLLPAASNCTRLPHPAIRAPCPIKKWAHCASHGGFFSTIGYHNNLRRLSPRGNSADRATAALAEACAKWRHRGCRVISATDPYGRILGFLNQSRFFLFQAAPQLYSRG